MKKEQLTISLTRFFNRELTIEMWFRRRSNPTDFLLKNKWTVNNDEGKSSVLQGNVVDRHISTKDFPELERFRQL